MRHRIKKIPTLSKLQSHHLLHSDKSTCFYNIISKVKGFFNSIGSKDPSSYVYTKHDVVSSRRYGCHASLPRSWRCGWFLSKVRAGSSTNKLSTIPLVLSSVALLLVLGLSVGCVGGANSVYAETVTEEQCNSETKLALSLNGVTGDSVNLSKNVDDDIKAGTISKVAQDFNVVACMVRNYKLYVQAESSLLKNEDLPDALYGVGDNVAETSFGDNTWGYNVAPKGATSTNYNTVPELAETIPEAYTGTTSTTNTGQDFTITFAAKFGNSKPAGHYTSNVLLSMVAEPRVIPALYSVKYDGNGGSNVPATQSNPSNGATESTITLQTTTIPTKANNSFRGWSTTQNGSVTHEPGANITLTEDVPETTLYAVWQPVTNKLTTISNMQQMTSTICSQTTTPSKWDTTSGVPTAQLTDSRDSKKYWVAKLADGNCWMTQNLDYNDQSGTQVSTNSNEKPANWQVLYAARHTRQYWDPGEKITSGSKLVAADNNTDKHLLVGNYYSWQSATAGTGSSVSTDGQNANSSICPNNWMLPIGYKTDANTTATTNKTFAKLISVYSIEINATEWSKLTGAPLYFVRSGIITDSGASGVLLSVGKSGYCWSSTSAYGDEVAYSFLFSSSDIDLSRSSRRYNGLAVRCVAK